MLAMISALLFVVAAAIGVWWVRESDQQAKAIVELKAEHAAFLDSQEAVGAEVQERYATLDVPGRWAAVVAANEKYAKAEEAFNAAYPTSQKTIPLAAGFALVSAVRECLGTGRRVQPVGRPVQRRGTRRPARRGRHDLGPIELQRARLEHRSLTRRSRRTGLLRPGARQLGRPQRRPGEPFQQGGGDRRGCLFGQEVPGSRQHPRASARR